MARYQTLAKVNKAGVKKHFFKDMDIIPFSKKPFFFTCLKYNSFENTVGKEGIARYNWFFFRIFFLKD